MECKHKIEVMITKEEINKAVKALGERLTKDFKDKEPVVIVGVLKGLVHFHVRLGKGD